MRRNIFRITSSSDSFNPENGQAVPFLSYNTDFYADEADSIIQTDGADATLEELVELCDHDAENRNAHDFCGAHRLLGAVLFRKYGRESATETMREIALLGGLQGMAGVCSDGDAYEELSVGRAGYDWGGHYGAPPEGA